MLGAILGTIGIIRIALWQKLGVFDYGEHWVLVACTVGAALRYLWVSRGLDAALHFEANWLRSSERIGTVRGHTRRRHGARDLFQHRACFLEGNASLVA